MQTKTKFFVFYVSGDTKYDIVSLDQKKFQSIFTSKESTLKPP